MFQGLMLTGLRLGPGGEVATGVGAAGELRRLQ